VVAQVVHILEETLLRPQAGLGEAKLVERHGALEDLEEAEQLVAVLALARVIVPLASNQAQLVHNCQGPPCIRGCQLDEIIPDQRSELVLGHHVNRQSVCSRPTDFECSAPL